MAAHVQDAGSHSDGQIVTGLALGNFDGPAGTELFFSGHRPRRCEQESEKCKSELGK